MMGFTKVLIEDYFRKKMDQKVPKNNFWPKMFLSCWQSPITRDAKFPGILRRVNFHREFWEFCGNIGNFREYSETLGIFK